MKKIIMRLLLPLTSIIITAYCAYAFHKPGQDILLCMPLYSLLIPLVWILIFSAVYLQPRERAFIMLPYATVVITNIIYHGVGRRTYDWLTRSSWVEPFFLLICFFLGMIFIEVLFWGIRHFRMRKTVSGYLCLFLSLLFVLIPILLFNGNPVSAIQARHSLDVWREKYVNEDQYEVRGFHYNWLESDFYYEFWDRKNGRIEWLHYLPGKNGKAPEFISTWENNAL